MPKDSKEKQTESSGSRSIPRHVAIIMDGNGRWALSRGLPRHAGHKAGVDSVRRVIESSASSGVEVLTLFAFSTENWRRPELEVNLLMKLFLSAIQREAAKLHTSNIRLKVIGDISAFPLKLRKSIKSVEDLTALNTGLLLQIAANYGGRWDITQAARRLAERVSSGQLTADEISQEMLSKEMAFGQTPIDPDLLIRTGGEHRLSNFLLWQSAYSELYFTDLLWPDFDAVAFDQAIAEYASRQRRFGHTGNQVVDKAVGITR